MRILWREKTDRVSKRQKFCSRWSSWRFSMPWAKQCVLWAFVMICCWTQCFVCVCGWVCLLMMRRHEYFNLLLSLSLFLSLGIWVNMHPLLSQPMPAWFDRFVLCSLRNWDERVRVLRLNDREKQAVPKLRPDGSWQDASYRESGRVCVRNTFLYSMQRQQSDLRYEIVETMQDAISTLAWLMQTWIFFAACSTSDETTHADGLFTYTKNYEMSMPRSIERRKLLRIAVATSGTEKQRHFLTARLVLVDDCLSSPRHCRQASWKD